LDCFDGYIGLSGCGSSTPESGVYINSLPGISIEVANGIADSEQRTFLNAWTDIQARALRRFKTDTINYLKKKFDLNIISDFINTGRAFTNDVTAAAAGYRGRKISAVGEYPSKLQQLYVEEVLIYLSNGISTTLYIIDENGETQFSQAVTASSTGWKRVFVGENFDSQDLYVVYDSTTVNSVKTVNTSDLEYNLSCYCQDVCGDCGDCDLSTTGVSTTDLDDIDSYDTGTNSFGLSVIFGLRCSWEPLLCANREAFIEPLVNLLGAEFCSEQIYTTRVNRFTTLDKQKAKDLRIELEGAYQSSLSAVLDGLSVEDYDCCIDCQPIISQVQCTP
jgi:hypothetical protein